MIKTVRFLFLVSALALIGIVLTEKLSVKTNNEDYSDLLKRYDEQVALADAYKKGNFKSPKELVKRDRPDLAFLHDFELTKDPALGYPPTDRRFEAYRIGKEKLARKSALKAIDNVVWQERGPNNVGGRTRALMFDPNDPEVKKVWAGSVSGGLWYNNDITDVESKWTAVNDFMSNLAIACITYDPDNTSTFYLGTGELVGTAPRGNGIWTSNDSGLTWDQMSSTNNSDFHYVQKIVFSLEGTMLAATEAGLFRSVDNGSTWENVISDDERFFDIELGSDGTIYVGSGSNPSSVYRSTDDGINWDDITPNNFGRRVELATAPSDPNILYAIADGNGTNRDEIEIGYFVKSSDKGDSWESITIPKNTSQSCAPEAEEFTRGQAFYDLILSVNPEDSENLIAGGIDLNRTLNAGDDWGLISYWTGSCDDYVHADQHAIVYRPGYANEAIFGSDGGVSYSANINAADPNFEDRNNGYNVTQFYSVATKNELNTPYIMGGTQDNGTQRIDQGGIGTAIEVSGGDGAFCFVDQLNSDIQISSYVYNVYYQSTNGGKTFFNIVNDQSRGAFINPAAYDSDAKILYSAGANNQLMRVVGLDGTPGDQVLVSLTALDGGRITNIKVSPYSEHTLFVGSNGNKKVLKITNADANSPTVTDITGSVDSGNTGVVSSIDIGATEDHLLITYSNYGVTSVYETTDGGTNWVNKEGDLPDMPVRWGLFNPNDRNEVLLATEVGVWSTDDLSSTSPEWEPTNDGLANVRCDMLKYRAADQQIVIATHGRGFFTTNVFATTQDADFSVQGYVGYEGTSVNFNDNSLLATDWSWTFGDGNTSTDQNPSNIYTNPGVYDVNLSINGGAETIMKSVTILPNKTTPYLLTDGGDFESNPNDFAGGSLVNDDNLWELGVPSGRLATVSSGTQAWKTLLDSDLTDVGANQFALFTPNFDLSDGQKEYKISFMKSAENAYSNSPFAMKMQFSTDKGLTWSTLGSTENLSGSVNWYNRGVDTGSGISPSIFEDQFGWSYAVLPANSIDQSIDNQETKYNLNFLAGESNVAFRFLVGIGTSETDPLIFDRDGFMIDDFEITVSDPTAAFDVNFAQAAVGRVLQFRYAGNGAESYSWDFGDGTVSDLQNPTHAYAASGDYTVSLTITSPSGTDTVVKTDYISILPKFDAPFVLEDGGDFETNQNAFIAGNISGTSWELGNSTIDGKDGTASGDFAWVLGLDDAEYENNTEAYLYSPTFDMSVQKKYDLSFKAKYRLEGFTDGQSWDGLIVEFSTDLGVSWVKLNDTMEDGWYNSITTPEAIFGSEVPIFSGNTEGVFETYTTDVTFLVGESDVIFRIVFLSDVSAVEAGVAIDDFSISAQDLVAAVPEFSYENVSGCSNQVITFTDNSTGAVDSYSWDFGVGASPSTATGQGPHEVTYSATEAQTSTVSLTVVGILNGSVTETKVDEILTAPDHTPTITENNNGSDDSFELQASSGDEYQWYFNSEVIENATSNIYTASDLGNYQVEVLVDGCFGRSEVYEVDVATSLNNNLVSNFSVYPNPSNGMIFFESPKMSTISEEIELRLYDLTGKLVLLESLSPTNLSQDLSALNPGTYILELNGSSMRETTRIVLN